MLGAPYLRHRDEDLLPFPLTDTIHPEEACELLGFRRLQPVVRLIEEGKFEAYQLAAQAPWRISRSSLYAFMREVSRPSARTILSAIDFLPHRRTSDGRESALRFVSR